MNDERLPNIHPGEILHIEFLEPLQITPYRLSKDIGVAQTRISEILSGQRSITADTAWRLSRYFGNSAQFWLNLQAEYDLRQAQLENRETYLRIVISPAMQAHARGDRLDVSPADCSLIHQTSDVVERCHIISQLTELETKLNGFSLDQRTSALAELVAVAERGEVPCEPVQDVVNLHCHTFFSFNAYGYSPDRAGLAGEKVRFAAIGIVDFDVLDGVEEFLDACDLAGVRGSAGMETRVFIPEFATREINSPGEPGIFYHMGIGFTSGTVPPAAAPILAAMRARADGATATWQRASTPTSSRSPSTTTAMCCRSPRRATPPSATCSSRTSTPPTGQFGGSEAQKAAFWARSWARRPTQIAAIIGDNAKFHNLVRAKLMKRGGVGYVQPSPETFPSVAEVHAMITACGALPCATWLDGTSAGEQAIDELLDLLIGKGVVALNIIPDRNWNLADPETRQLKVAKLYEIVALPPRATCRSTSAPR